MTVAGEWGVGEDAALVAAGWERRFVADTAGVQQAVELYEAAGFEVVLRSPSPDEFGEACAACAASACTAYTVVYTRRKADEE